MWLFFFFILATQFATMGNRIGPLHIERKMDGGKKGEMMMRFSGTMLLSYFHREIKKERTLCGLFQFQVTRTSYSFCGLWLASEWVSEWALVIIIYSIKWSHMNTTITITSTLILKLYMYIWFESHAFLVKSYGFFLLSTFWVPIFRSHFI